MSALKKVFVITWKDILSEMRTREIISSVLVFTLLVVVIFNFAFNAEQGTAGLVAPGILWVTFTFAGVLSLSRSFVPEKEQGCLEGMMIAPISREIIYFGKMLGSLLSMLVIEAVAIPVFALLFNIPVFSLQLLAIIVLATLGFATVGTLFSALAVNTRAREMVLPILFLPIVIPLIIAAVNGSWLALNGDSWSSLSSSLSILAAFDVIFLVVSYFVFAFIIEE